MSHASSTPQDNSKPHDGSSAPAELPPDATPEQIQADKDETLERLSETVEQLAAKADVKAQAKGAAQEAKAEAQRKLNEGSEKVKQGADHAVNTYQGWPVAAQAGVIAVPLLLIVWLIVRAVRNR